MAATTGAGHDPGSAARFWPRGLSAAMAVGALALGLAIGIAAAAPAGAVSEGPRARQASTGWGGLATASAPAVPTIDWKPCGADRPGLDCATVELPTDYDDPDAGTTSVALVRVPAGDPGARIGTLFTNPGGPGGSGVSAIVAGGKALAARLDGRFDVLGFDPRGTNASDPATCFDSADEEQTFFQSVSEPYTDDAVAELTYLGQVGELARRCQATSAERFRHMSTANVARDMDVLRQAVGDEKLSYYGVSYGTVLGQTYARLFPDRVRALALDGNVDPADYVGAGDRRPVGVRTNQGLSLAETFGEFLRLCTEGGENCALNAVGDPAEVVDEVLARARQEPIVVTVEGKPVPIAYNTVVLNIVSSLYDPGAYPAVAEFLAGLAVGDDAKVQGSELGRRGASLPLGQDYVSQGGNAGVLCADIEPMGSPIAYRQVADEQEATYGPFGRVVTWNGLNRSAVCEFWGDSARDRDAYRGDWNQPTDAEVLLLNPRFDPVTAWQNVGPAAAHFRNATVVTVQGWGHTAITAGSECAEAVVTAYLLAAKVPADAADTCPADAVPFAQPAAAEPGGKSSATSGEDRESADRGR